MTINSNTFVCKCGWEGTMFQTKHFTVKELTELREIVTEKSKNTLDTWHRSLCPRCNSPNLVHIGDAFQRVRDYINLQIKENGWGDANSCLPPSFRFTYKKISNGKDSFRLY